MLDQLPDVFTINDIKKIKGDSIKDKSIYAITERYTKDGVVEKLHDGSYRKLTYKEIE